jgi:hypothetical protein
MMLDDRIKQQFMPKIDIITGLRTVHTAQVNAKANSVKDSTGKTKKVDVEVIWDNACGIEAQDCTVCDYDGEKLSTNAQQYSLSFCKEVTFSVDEFDYLDNELDAMQAIAKGLLRADKQLVEAYAQYAVQILNANKGVNQMGTGSKGVVNGSDTYILPAYWDAKLMAYFMRVSQLNRFTNPILLSGSNLFEEYLVIQAAIQNAEGKGDAALMNALRIYFDLFNIDSVNNPDLVTYMVSQGSVAMANRAYNPDAIQVVGAADLHSRWTKVSEFVPELKYDMFYLPECSNDMVKHSFKTKLTADLFVNPEGCEVNNTGILTFLCGSPT